MRSITGAEAPLQPSGYETAILSGECRNSLLPLAETERVSCGIWEATPGKWTSEWNDDWEFFTVLSGRGTLTDGLGSVHALEAGVSVWVPQGSTGVWEITETVRKSYVVPSSVPRTRQPEG
jgi:uncharacterized cupin superfamily protein